MSCSKVGFRSCAFCLNPLAPSEVKKCSKCQRRTYCSKECQAADWKGSTRHGKPLASLKAIGLGQGHKRWCGLEVGEEGIDWAVKEAINSNQGRGLVALRDLPPLYRILVDGIQNLRQPGLTDHPGFKFLPDPPSISEEWRGELPKKLYMYAYGGGPDTDPGGSLTADLNPTSALGLRSSLMKNACDANVSILIDKGVRAMYAFANRKISAGEELGIQWTPYNRVFNSTYKMPHPDVRVTSMLKREVVCPSSCVCKDLTLRSKLMEMNDLFMYYKRAADARNREEGTKSLPYLLKALEMAEGLKGREKLPPTGFVNIYFAIFQACSFRKETWALGKPYYEKLMAHNNAVVHPDGSMDLRRNPLSPEMRAMEEFYATGRYP